MRYNMTPLSSWRLKNGRKEGLKRLFLIIKDSLGSYLYEYLLQRCCLRTDTSRASVAVHKRRTEVGIGT